LRHFSFSIFYLFIILCPSLSTLFPYTTLFRSFYTIQGIVFNNSAGAKSPGKNPVTLGLVGLHILHKAKGQGKWLWSTFEQNDNLDRKSTRLNSSHLVPRMPSSA